MTAVRSTSRHPAAGELVRRLDGELDSRAEARLSRHLERCTECQARLAELAEQSRETSRLLAHAAGVDETSVADRRLVARKALLGAITRRRSLVRVRRSWAAAAAVAALLVVSLTVDPLRAWVMERFAPGDAPPGRGAVASLPAAVVGREGSVIAFEPSGAIFELSVERRQLEGEVLLQVRDREQATAQVTNAGTESMLVLPSGLRIENSAVSRASYRVTLPMTVERVVVRVGEEEARVVEVRGADWAERITLR